MRTSHRRAAAFGVPLCLLVAITAAGIVDHDDVQVDFTGVTFALESAAGTTAGWVPTAADWRPSTETWTVDLAEDTLAPGGTFDVRVAVRNVSGTPAAVVLALADPDPQPTDLFDGLTVSLSEAGTPLASGPAGAVRVLLPGTVGPGGTDVRVFDLRLTLPAEAAPGDRTGVQVLLEGSSR